MKNERIPIHGSFTRPANPDDAKIEMFDGRQKWTGGNLNVKIFTEEFTSVCPTTGQPDFNTIEINYHPNEFYLESKTVKFYLWAFRDYGAHCETLAKKIAEDVFDAISPKFVEVKVNQFPRGGLKIVSSYTKTK